MPTCNYCMVNIYHFLRLLNFSDLAGHHLLMIQLNFLNKYHMIFAEVQFFLSVFSSTKTVLSSLSCLSLAMAVPNKTNSVNRYPSNEAQFQSYLSTQGNQNSVDDNSHQQEGKLNDGYRDRSRPFVQNNLSKNTQNNPKHRKEKEQKTVKYTGAFMFKFFYNHNRKNKRSRIFFVYSLFIFLHCLIQSFGFLFLLRFFPNNNSFRKANSL